MFDWLEEGISDFIIVTYKELFTSMSSVYDIAIKSPSSFNNTIWNTVTKFNNDVVLPVAWSILSLFLLMELASLFKRADAKGMDSIYWIMTVFLKIMLAKLLMDNMTTIINAIFEVSGHIVTNANITMKTMSEASTTELGDALSKCSTVTLLGYFMTSLIIKLASGITKILAEIIVKLRFIEIYVFTGIAALPFATLPSQEYGVIGKNFIKRMCSLAIHVIFIILVLYMYSVLVSGSMPTVNSANPMDALFAGLGYSILAVIALFQTGGWSRQLMGI